MEIEDALLLRIQLTKKADDPRGIARVSVGGAPEIGGYYIVYRGSKEAAIACMEATLASMKAMAEVLGPGKEPDIAPDSGKKYA